MPKRGPALRAITSIRPKASPSRAEAARPSRIDGVVIGVLRRIASPNEVVVAYESPSGTKKVRARATVAIGPTDIGRKAALLFEQGDPEKPILLGLLARFSPETKEGRDAATRVDVDLDEERITLTADREIVLRCGEASITLTRAGKILLRGAYVSSRSRGANVIRGGSVQIN